MPGWPSRFLPTNSGNSTNSSSDHLRYTPKPEWDRDSSLPPRAPFGNFPGPPQHGAPGIPSRPSQTTPPEILSSSSPRERPHTRSASDKVPALFGGARRKAITPPCEMEAKSVPLADDYFSHGGSPKGKTNKVVVDERDMEAGHCATCDSRVRWPRGLTEYRCSTCLMINDLRLPNRHPPRETGHELPSRAGTVPSRSATNAVASMNQPITLDRTKIIIDRCIDSLLEAYRCDSPQNCVTPDSPPESPLKCAPAPPSESFKPLFTDRGRVPVKHADISTTLAEEFQLNGDGPHHSATNMLQGSVLFNSTKANAGTHPTSISRKPLPAPLESLPVRPGRKPLPPSVHLPSGIDRNTVGSPWSQEPNSNVQNGRGLSPMPGGRPRRRSHVAIFRPLEDFVVRCFSDQECLNGSFYREDQKLRKTSHSQDNVKHERDLSPPRIYTPDVAMSELDAKTLLLGDVAENGFWWTGKDTRSRSVGRRQKPGPTGDSSKSLVHSRSPQIDWTRVDEWYSLVLNPGKDWRSRLKANDAYLEGNTGISQPGLCVQDVEQAMNEAATHMQKTLLRASEALLKRPGRPLRDPHDIRFLLIIISNPSLYPFHTASAIPERRAKQAVPFPTIGAEHGAKSKFPALHEGPSDQGPINAWEQGNAFGIIKRILGLLAHLSSECHRFLTAWLSRYDESRFRDMVDLVQRFITHRMKRQQGRKRSNVGNPTDGLIPNLSGTSADTSAQLHAALGLSGPNKGIVDDRNQHAFYTEDWQIKAAAKIMALLFAANKNFHGERNASSLAVDAEMSKSGSLSRTYIKNHGQLLSTSDFYNTMVDYADLVADFDLWESSQKKFAFCQYPFFLSVGAKTRIMEHDARRQMELRAREAFFNSIIRNKNLEQYLVLKVRRECLVEDSLSSISEVVGGNQGDIKKGLRVQFVGEEGIDAGGLRKEWFLSLVREIFDPHHALFLYDEESRFCYFNPHSFETSDQFFLVGALLGLAIYNSTILDVALPPFTFKKLLMSGNTPKGTKPPYNRAPLQYTLEDLAEWRPSLARGLRQLLKYDGNVKDTFCRDFCIEVERYGSTSQIELCPNGARRAVTNANRHEFVDLYIRYLLDTQVARQYEPFKRGFFTVCGGNALSLFQPEEIELLVRGSDEPLDVPSLKAVAIYEGWHVGSGEARRAITNPAKQLPLLRWFWDFFCDAAPGDQRKILSFITGSDRIPAVGAANLVIKVCFGGKDASRFPIARTCFNQLLLFKYESREELERKLWMAVCESEGFGLK